jgi:hypothetical protein
MSFKTKLGRVHCITNEHLCPTNYLVHPADRPFLADIYLLGALDDTRRFFASWDGHGKTNCGVLRSRCSARKYRGAPSLRLWKGRLTVGSTLLRRRRTVCPKPPSIPSQS